MCKAVQFLAVMCLVDCEIWVSHGSNCDYYLASFISFQYSGNVSSQTSTASASAAVAKPHNSLASETPVVTTKPLPEITATSDIFVPKTSVKRGIVLEDKQWHELRMDYSKLIQHYLMLSKIRLTCRYNNLCLKIIQVYWLGHRLDSHRSGVQLMAWIEIFSVLQNCLYQLWDHSFSYLMGTRRITTANNCNFFMF